ncbi:MAG: hypothetical protein ACK5PP_14835 [Acidimicrobiales bacterium]
METGSEPRRVAAQALASRHLERGPRRPDGDRSRFAYAERPRPEHAGWGLRSALVRLAQPEPQWAARVLTVVRRVDATVGPLRRPLDRHTVLLDDATDPVVDARVVDLGRLATTLDPTWSVRAVPAVVDPIVVDDVVTGYAAGLAAGDGEPLEPEEITALPVVVVCLALDHLADTVAAWAVTAPGPAPLDLIEVVCDGAWAALDACGAPTEADRPRRRPTSA